ncbi:hypothetical protein N7519_007656 [Penicillium mononematosum]|uniref:uncharacterized protein n=1 Tax=Penicillium mononematosum TaxID=268346 RepID=UPI0025487264|nr:uncharacterized protein N7519_007656 [Penicillium mononematosum]KAJ6186355.1 hypothetical protein N7519_007656 [Penicillium mononematosum]
MTSSSCSSGPALLTRFVLNQDLPFEVLAGLVVPELLQALDKALLRTERPLISKAGQATLSSTMLHYNH